jgi:LysM domain.
MIDVRTRGLSRQVLAVLAALAIAVLLAACVPEPANRASPSGSGSATTPSPTPVPTPAGPTPTPSFVRPTPTPQPTFLVHLVVAGDNLDKIAKRYGTTGRSIAYWNRATYPSLDPDSDLYRPNYIVIGWTLALIPNATVDPENLPPPPSPPTPSSSTGD